MSGEARLAASTARQPKVTEFQRIADEAETALEALGLRMSQRAGARVHARTPGRAPIDITLTRGSRVWSLTSIEPAAGSRPGLSIELPPTITATALRQAICDRYGVLWPSEWAEATRLVDVVWDAATRSERRRAQGAGRP